MRREDPRYRVLIVDDEESTRLLLARLREPLASHPVKVELPGRLPLVRVDAMLIEQVLANLLENAWKYTPPGTPITLSAELQAREVLVSVEDQGPGLPPGEREALFAKFHRGSMESAVGGVGLGLAICRAVVNLHGGRIWAERLDSRGASRRGAAFRFTLPLEEVPPVPPE